MVTNAPASNSQNAGVSKQSAKEADQTKAIAADRAQPIDLPAPVGEDMKGIIIPQYDIDGRLSMKFFADIARKLDNNQVEIHGLTINFFEKDGKDITVVMPHGIFNLETKILSSDTQVTIKREDFEMIGQSVEFDTIKRSGTMQGHVHTDVRNGVPSQEI